MACGETVVLLKRYLDELRRDAVDVARLGGSTVLEVAADSEFAEETVRQWMCLADINKGIKNGTTGSEQSEMVKLRRE